jgi:hypothetical protein
MLFQMRGRPPGKSILNRTIIPMLCAKAGLPLRDTMGAITSHRGRASAVTALASMPQGMTLPELMAWCHLLAAPAEISAGWKIAPLRNEVQCPLYSMKDAPAVDTRYALESQRCSVRGGAPRNYY